MRNSNILRKASCLLVSLTCLAGISAVAVDAQAQTRTLEFRTTEVTTPTLSMTADGRELVFDLLGHLFRLPVNGGMATQLTYGREFDGAPAVSRFRRQ